MQIIHCSLYRDAEGRPRTDARTKKEAAAQLGPDWIDRLTAEDNIVNIFGDHLDDDYILTCNSLLLEDGPDADMLLVGPNGVWAFEFVHDKGSFQAENDKWSVLDPETTEYEPVEASPIATARDNASAVYDFLHSKELPVPWVNPVLILTHPDANLYTDGPVANIIKADEVTQFVTQEVRDLDPVMDETDVELVTTTLKPFFSAPSLPVDTDKPVARKLMGMNTGQWVVIFVLGLLNICILGGFAWLLIAGP